MALTIADAANLLMCPAVTHAGPTGVRPVCSRLLRAKIAKETDERCGEGYGWSGPRRLMARRSA
jgi:hypothetical protein